MSSTQIDRIDGLSSSVAIKGPCRVAATTNVVLSGLQTVNGAALVSGDRVLVTAQNSAIENGIYVVDTGPWRRSKDFNKTKDVARGTMVYVNSGDTGGSTRYVVTSDINNIGASAITFQIDVGVLAIPDESISVPKLADDTVNLINRPKSPDEIKILITADWQARPEEPTEVAAERAMMDDIETYHSDVDWALFLGDLVDRPTENSTGAPSARGYQQLFSDMRQRIPSIPLSRWMFLAGNHDRDGTGAGMWVDAWTYRSYRTEVGPLWYYVDYGNLRWIFMGDMSGSVSGEILDVAVDWFNAVMARSKNYNVWISMHQPPDPSVYTASADPLSGSFQRNPSRITDVINANDNVCLCTYGHVGGTLANATMVTTAYGTTWMNMQMGVPTAVTNGFDLHYATTLFQRGATTFDVVRWNATTHAPLGMNNATIALKYPLQLSGDQLDFDGRGMVDPQIPYFYGPIVSYQSASDFRPRDGVPSYAVPNEMLIAHKIIVGDDAANNVTGQGVASGYYVPGAPDSDTDSGGNQVYSQPAYGLGGLVGFRRQSNDETDYGSSFVAYAKSVGTGTVDLVLEGKPLSSALAGAALPAGCGFSIDANYVVDPLRHIRLRSYTKAEVLAPLASTPVGMLIRVSDGDGGNPCLAVSLGGTSGWKLISLGATIV